MAKRANGPDVGDGRRLGAEQADVPEVEVVRGRGPARAAGAGAGCSREIEHVAPPRPAGVTGPVARPDGLATRSSARPGRLRAPRAAPGGSGGSGRLGRLRAAPGGSGGSG
ncbi:hypothetical protein ACFXOG_33815, partial [Streptomyces sp. NPDC059168]